MNQWAYCSDCLASRLRSSRYLLQVVAPRPRTLKRLFASAEPASFRVSAESRRNTVAPSIVSSADHCLLLPSFAAFAKRARRTARLRGRRSLSNSRSARQGMAAGDPSRSRDGAMSQRDCSAGRISTRNNAVRTSASAVSASQPTGSPRPIALASTPTTGIASVPTEMATAGKRRTSLNHAQWQKSVATMTA